MRSLSGRPLLCTTSRTVAGRLCLLLLLMCATLLGGCGLFPEVKDETASWSANKLYSEARSSMSEGVYDKAIKLYEKLESRYPYGRFAQQAQIDVAYAYFKQNEVASSIAACDRFIKLHPNHPSVDYVYYLKGLVTFNEDQGLMGHISDQDQTERDPKGMRDSFNVFKDLVTRYPDSKYAADATLRMQYLVNAMASHELHVARYYVKRGAYLAAANRAQQVVKNFAGTPQVEEALFIMVKSYDQLGLTDLRNDAERVMRQNFPKSLYFGSGPVAAATPWWKLW